MVFRKCSLNSHKLLIKLIGSPLSYLFANVEDSVTSLGPASVVVTVTDSDKPASAESVLGPTNILVPGLIKAKISESKVVLNTTGEEELIPNGPSVLGDIVLEYFSIVKEDDSNVSVALVAKVNVC